MAESNDKQRRGGLIPFRIPLPNPLAWRPRFGRGDNNRKQNNFASTSVAISETMLAPPSHCATATATAASMPPLSSSAASSPPPTKVALKPASDVFAGALARAASQSTIHPLDTLKVRLQTRKGLAGAGSPPILSKFGKLVPPSKGGSGGVNIGGASVRAVGSTGSGAAAAGMQVQFDLRAAGQTLGSLYRGVIGAASGAGIAIGAYFAFYGAACNALSRHTDLAPSAVAFVSGGIAAVGSSVVKVPLAVCIRSVQAGVYPNVFSAAKQIVAATGPRGLFTGYAPTVLEDVPDMAIKFAAYESMREVHRRVYKGRVATPQEDFAMGAVAGALAAAATTPLDVIKTNMMCTAASRPTMMSASQAVIAQGGMAGFFRGVGTRAVSNGINSAVFFCFFEAIRSSIKTMNAQKLQQQQMQMQQLPVAVAARPAPVATVTSVEVVPRRGVRGLTDSDEERDY